MNSKWKPLGIDTPCFECGSPRVHGSKIGEYDCSNPDCVTHLSDDEWFAKLVLEAQKKVRPIIETEAKNELISPDIMNLRLD